VRAFDADREQAAEALRAAAAGGRLTIDEPAATSASPPRR
jgi:hypothetical protein